MIIARAPYRISFFGGGTDYPQWYLEHGGAVLSTTIDKYCYLSCRRLPPFFEIKHRIVWSRIETVDKIEEIAHPAVREGLKYLGFDDSMGFEIHHQGDLPARSGMGSSSAFAVGLIKALSALRGKVISKHQLAMRAIELEQKILRENVGSQDQVASAYGGLNRIYFRTDGEIRVDPVTLPASRLNELESRLLLFYTGTSRTASEIAGKVIENLDKKKSTLFTMRSLVDEAVSILDSPGSTDDFGKLLHQSWLLKRELSPVVSNSNIEDIYERGLRGGALGGKLLGAGSSGFILFYVPLERQAQFRMGMGNLLEVPFRFETQGSSLVYYGEDSVAREGDSTVLRPPFRPDGPERSALM